MGTTFRNTTTTIVRRKGTADEVFEDHGDEYRPEHFFGDRRSRQIGKRHWLRKRHVYFHSHGDYADMTTAKFPGKRKVNLSRPALSR